MSAPHPRALDLSPARWIWSPGDRCLPNSFVLFRRELELDAAAAAAAGWVVADSRYRLTVNGERVQWGPAPSDPREQEVDPLDLTTFLKPGRNVIGVEVCYFGHGDGSWAAGAPGLLMRLDVEHAGGEREQICTDGAWSTRIDRAHRPGQHARWMLRALQEDFDARLHPHGWDTPGHEPDGRWLPALELRGSAATPAIFAGGADTVHPSKPADRPDMDQASATPPRLQARSIPLMVEEELDLPAARRAATLRWGRPTADWFESRVPGCFELEETTDAGSLSLPIELAPAPGDGVDDAAGPVARTLLFELPEQVVGFPFFEVDAPAGTVIELIAAESHDPGTQAPWVDHAFWAWSRFTCAGGRQRFECFDYESAKWLQLHAHGHDAAVTVHRVGTRRRAFDWPTRGHVNVDEPGWQAVMDASVNTMLNSCQECNQDGGARERQQYSGDCGHQQEAARRVFGPTAHSARYLQTFSRGLTHSGYFLDCWPGVDRLVRLWQREISTSPWGPLLDHGVGFLQDCHRHVMDTGGLDDLDEVLPRLARFVDYLDSTRDGGSLLPVEGLGTPTVWIDHHAYLRQRHKRCAYNLYAAAVLEHHYAPLMELAGDAAEADRGRALGRGLLAAAADRYWDPGRGVFQINRGDDDAAEAPRFCDRSLATALLYGQLPGGGGDTNSEPALSMLADLPEGVGESYPANAYWRLMALARGGRGDVVVDEVATRWAGFESVKRNNTLQEGWNPKVGTKQQFSHCPLGPVCVLFGGLLGLAPTEPGFARFRLEPRLEHAPGLDVSTPTPAGTIGFGLAGPAGADRTLRVSVPAGAEGVAVLPDGQEHPLPAGATTELAV